MKDTLQKYFQKKSIYTPHDCDVCEQLKKFSDICSTPKVAVVIPIKNEYPGIKDTLISLSVSAVRAKTTLHVVCVVNCHENDNAKIKQNNSQTLSFLNEDEKIAGLFISALNLTSEGYYLPEKDGVGYARKAGMDYALASGSNVIACMDADTLVAENYAEELLNFSRNHEKRKFALIPFRHQKAASEKLQQAINAYENYMMLHAEKLREAGTPYWAPILGPSIVCTAEGYCSCGGMNRRVSGEDFYFLQSLIKLEISSGCAQFRAQVGEKGVCMQILDNRAYVQTDEARAPLQTDAACSPRLRYTPHFLNTEVYPSARISDRVLFGTGPKMKQLISMVKIEYPVFPERCYEAVKEFIEKKESCQNELAGFMNKENFLSVWKKICVNNPSDPVKQEVAFHIWFDGLKIIRAIHAVESAL